jgi:hypothetical protein
MYYLLLQCAVIEELSMLHVFKITDFFVWSCATKPVSLEA